MDFSSFSHGQIHSKVWLCEILEGYLLPKNKIAILGCWHNVMGIILMVRNPNKNLSITGIDIDSSAIEIANSLTTAWRYEFLKPFENICADVNHIDYNSYDVIINCSVEHISSDEWFDNIPAGKLVCLQSMNISRLDDPVFKVTNPNPTLDTFISKYKLAETIYLGEKRFSYPENSYSRFCYIGIK